MSSPNLPEREWLSITALADRWGVSSDYILHLGAQDLLRMGVLADGWRIRVEPLEADTQYDNNHKGFTALFAKDIASIEQRGAHVVDEARRPTQDEVAADHMPLFEINPLHSLGFGLAADVEVLGINIDGCAPTSSFVAAGGALVQRDDLLVRRADWEEFERVYGIGSTPKNSESTKPGLDVREEKSYLQLIRLAIIALDLPREPYPAANAIQELAAQYGVEVRSERTVAEILKRANNLDD